MTIMEVSEACGLSRDTLRYYERVGLIPRVARDKSGNREYNEKDCGWIDFIKCMRGAGIPIEVLIDYVQMFESGDATRETRKALLTEQRDLLAERIAGMQKTLERLNYKINNFYDIIYRAERELLQRDGDD